MKLQKLLCAVVVALSANGAQAAPVLNDWVFNPIGDGFAAGQTIHEYIDVEGRAFFELTPTSGNGFSFTQHAVFNFTQADSNGLLFPITFPGGHISALFEATGVGNYNGTFSFTGGRVSVYHDVIGNYGSTLGIYGANIGDLIAEFDVLACGGGAVDANGSPVNGGQVSVFAQAAPGDLEPGFFFRGNGNDLSIETIAFAFTSANNVIAPTGNLVNEVACEFSGFSGPGCDGTPYANAPGHHVFLSTDGQLRLTEPKHIPEPGSLALFGIAMLGAAAAARRRTDQV